MVQKTKFFHHVTQEVGLLTHPSLFPLIVTEAGGSGHLKIRHTSKM